MRRPIVSPAVQAQQAMLSSRQAPPLRWHRPDTTGWTVIDLDAVDLYSEDPNYYRYEFPMAGGNFVITQTQPKDRRVRFVATGPTNIVWVGGEVRIDEPWTDNTYANDDIRHYSMREGVHFAGDFRLIYIEGLHLHGANLIEGIDLMDGYNMMPVIQNTRITVDVPQLPDASASDGIYHSDSIQSWAGMHSMRLGNTTLTNVFQGGMFGDGSYPTRPAGMTWKYTELSRVNYAYARKHTPATSQARLVNYVQNDRLVGPFVIKDVFVDHRPRRWGLSNMGVDGNGTFWSGTGDTDPVTGRRRWQINQTYPSQGTSDGDGGTAYWYAGRPPSGDYCRPAVPGIGYQLPENIDSEPYAIGGNYALSHLANRPVKRTAAEYENGGTVSSRGWKVVYGPDRVDEVLSTDQYLDEYFSTVGTYGLEYTAQTEHGEAKSVIEAQIIPEDVNWLQSVRTFDANIGTWVPYENSSMVTLSWSAHADGGMLRATANQATAVTARPGYNNGSHVVVYPGESVFYAVEMRQVSGATRNAQIKVIYINEGRAVIAEHTSTASALAGYFQLFTFTDTVPAGTAYVMVCPRVQGASSGEVFEIDNVHVGDVVALNRFRGDGRFQVGIEAFTQNNNPGSFTLQWNAGARLMEYVCTTSASIGAISSADFGGSRRLAVTPGENLEVSFKVRQTAGTAPLNGVRPQLYFRTSGGSFISTVDGTPNAVPSSSWQTITRTFAVPATAGYAQLNLYVQGAIAGSTFQFADVSVKLA